MRAHRNGMVLEEKQAEKLKSKDGMKIFRKEGRLRTFKSRGLKNVDPLKDWQDYYEKNDDSADLLNKYKPDIVNLINEKVRVEKEQRRERARTLRFEELMRRDNRLTEDEKKEYDDLRQEIHEEWLTKEKERDMEAIRALQDYSSVSKLDYWYEYYKDHSNWCLRERGEFTHIRIKLYADYKRLKEKEKDIDYEETAMKNHVHPNESDDQEGATKSSKEPSEEEKSDKSDDEEKEGGEKYAEKEGADNSDDQEGAEFSVEDTKDSDEEGSEEELCEYGKLRQSNIKERVQKMAESNFFHDLHDYKVKIGFKKK